jgi:hypothetical protein
MPPPPSDSRAAAPSNGGKWSTALVAVAAVVGAVGVVAAGMAVAKLVGKRVVRPGQAAAARGGGDPEVMVQNPLALAVGDVAVTVTEPDTGAPASAPHPTQPASRGDRPRALFF